jgi:hypothetical protein
MAELTKCTIDTIHAHSIEVFNPNAHASNPKISAKIGYGVAGRPVGEVSLNGLEQNEIVMEAAKILVEAIEKAFAPTVGTVDELENEAFSEPPPGLADF